MYYRMSLFLLIVVLLYTGCTLNRAGLGPPLPATYVAEEGNHRVVRLTATGAVDATLPGFSSPRGVFVDASGIYVADTGNHRIVQVTDMTGAGWTPFGSFGSGVGQFSSPAGLFVHTSGIYIADTDNHRIVRIDNLFGAGWTALGDPVTPGSEPNHFNKPNGIFVDSSGRVYVADTGNHRIVRMDDMAGTGWTTLGDPLTPDSGTGHFNSPRGIFKDTSGHIYVADTDNSRIVQTADMTVAGWTAFNGVGTSVGSLSQPKGVFVDTSGRISVTDGNNGRLVRMNDILGTGVTPIDLGQGSQPWGVCLR